MWGSPPPLQPQDPPVRAAGGCTRETTTYAVPTPPPPATPPPTPTTMRTIRNLGRVSVSIFWGNSVLFVFEGADLPWWDRCFDFVIVCLKSLLRYCFKWNKNCLKKILSMIWSPFPLLNKFDFYEVRTCYKQDLKVLYLSISFFNLQRETYTYQGGGVTVNAGTMTQTLRVMSPSAKPV